MEDAQSLWRLHRDRLDEPRVRRTLRLLQEALSQSDLEPAFDAILRRSGSR
jgi:hypothetical protein